MFDACNRSGIYPRYRNPSHYCVWWKHIFNAHINVALISYSKPLLHIPLQASSVVITPYGILREQFREVFKTNMSCTSSMRCLPKTWNNLHPTVLESPSFPPWSTSRLQSISSIPTRRPRNYPRITITAMKTPSHPPNSAKTIDKSILDRYHLYNSPVVRNALIAPNKPSDSGEGWCSFNSAFSWRKSQLSWVRQAYSSYPLWSHGRVQFGSGVVWDQVS